MSELITTNLFNEVLANPLNQGADTLLVVSGYASSAMVFHHFTKLASVDFRVKLIIGMTAIHGLSKTNHLGFKSLMEDDYDGRFECSYLKDFPVHSKVYTWLKKNEPIKAFSGSANYSQNAFLKKFQREVCSEIIPESGKQYFDTLIGSSIYCDNIDAEFALDIYKEKLSTDSLFERADEKDSFQNYNNVTLSFINRSKVISERSALNWGQRPELGRDPNQAYIPVPAKIARSDFFPEPKMHFTVNTDDGKLLICSRGQAGGKAIQTPHNNTLFGEYFRNRLGLASGEFVTMEHFVAYGRTDVDFYKIDEENYFMDFSV